MSDTADLDATQALRDLQLVYASALDRRDAAALLAAFHPDATVRIFEPEATEPRAVITGHEQLAFMPEVMRTSYAKTMHVISNSSVEIDGHRATSQLYCVAHHLILDAGAPRKVAAYLTYEDCFSLSTELGWRFSNRDIHFLWVEETPVLPWQSAAERGRFG
jgi:hypothetical protein